MKEQTFKYVTVPTGYINVNGIDYAYRSTGNKTGIPIVCLQHFTGTLEQWDPIIVDGLAEQRQVVLIDNTGIGNSGGETPDNVLAMSDDAINVIKALGIQKCDLLGFSMGGFLVQQMAALAPELFRKLIIIGTAPQGAKSLHSFPQLVEKAFTYSAKDRYLFMFATASEKSRKKLTDTLGRLFIRTEDRDKETSLAAIQTQVKAITKWGTDPVTIDLSTIIQPVLVVQGSIDEIMDSNTSNELYDLLPNAVLIRYPDSAHGSFNQYPELFVGQANAFLNNFE